MPRINKGQLIREAGQKIRNVEFQDNPNRQDGRRIKILEIEDLGDNLVRVVVDITVGDKKMVIGGDNTFMFKNPPLKVPTGQKETVTNEDGETYEVDIFEENHEKAIRTVLRQAIKAQRQNNNFKLI